MPKLIDLTGQRFGRLTVLYRDTQKIGGKAYWICQCDCGKIISTMGVNLRKGVTKSCGCLSKEITSQRRTIDLTGKHFGKLTVIEKDIEKSNKHRIYWLCQCECGNTVSVYGVNLRNGRTQSCGCLRKEHAPIKDMLNKTFGKLTVLNRDNDKIGKDAYWICKCECGNIVSVMGKSLRTGHTQSCGCLKSKGESKIDNILKSLNIQYEKQYSFEDLMGDSSKLRFDFAIFKDGNLYCLIEYQGAQHYESYNYFGGEEKFKQQQYYDNKKREYCKNKKIKLIEIPFWDFEKINKNYIISILQKEKERSS